MGKENILVGDGVVVMKHNQNPKYLAYALSTTNAQKQKSQGKIKLRVVNSGVPNIKKLSLPIPPLEKQEEIANLLDKFLELQKELEKELNLRKQQYEYYRDEILSFKQDNKIKWLTLGEIFEFTGGFPFDVNKYENSGFPILRIGNIANGSIDDEKLVFFKKEDYSENLDEFIIKPNELFISNAGTLKIGFNNKEINYWINQRIYKLTLKLTNLNWKYLFHLLTNNIHFITLEASSSNMVPNWSTTKMKEIKVPIPSLEKQEEIANLLNRFWDLSNSIRDGLPGEILLRKKQYEYYRDKLITKFI